MGVSTDGQICFGVSFEEGYEFPWDDHDDIEEWWIYKVHQLKHSKELYDKSGDYIGGVRPSQKDFDLYYSEKEKVLEEHPLPVELVNYCSGDYPMWILAAPSTILTNSRGSATEFSPEDLVVTDEEKQALVDFCKKFDLEPETEPRWMLTSFWG